MRLLDFSPMKFDVAQVDITNVVVGHFIYKLMLKNGKIKFVIRINHKKIEMIGKMTIEVGE